MMSALVALRTSILGKPEVSEDGEEQSLIRQAISTALAPVKVATSRPAIKFYLSAFLFFATSVTLLSISTSAYALFYYRYIPQINLERTIYFQYEAGIHPHATVPLQTSDLVSQQPYDIDVVLHLPRTPMNLAAGNFMLDLSLLTTLPGTPTSQSPYNLRNTTLPAGYTAIERSRRPTILPYSSSITSLSHTILNLPGHLLSFRDVDSSVLTVPMFERIEFLRGSANIPSHVYIELQSQLCLSPEQCPSYSASSTPSINLLALRSEAPNAMPAIQVYTAKIVFRARFQGLRYIIYNYRIVSYLLFSALFYMFALISMATAWAAISILVSTNRQKPDAEFSALIKSEDETASSRPKNKVKDEPSSTAEQRTSLYGIKSEEGEGITPDSSDAEHEARTGALISDLHHDAEDEDDEEEEQVLLDTNIAPLRSESNGIKQEDDDDGPSARFADSGIGTSMESEVVASGSGIVRRRSGRDSGDGGRISRNGSRPGSRVGRRDDGSR